VLVLLALCAGYVTSSVAAQDFDDGLSAYNVADYATAYRIWWPLSERGDPKSQSALGYLYYKGLGRPSDPQAASLWFRRAAERGQPTAQFFLGTLYLDGRGVTQDYTKAHMWCELAVTGGFEAGLACRDQAGLYMSTEDFARSSRMVVEWRRAREAAESRE
jgi:TPR repeat protein